MEGASEVAYAVFTRYMLTILSLGSCFASTIFQYTRYQLSERPNSSLVKGLQGVGLGVLCEQPKGVGKKELVHFFLILLGFSLFDWYMVTNGAGDVGGYGKLWVAEHCVAVWLAGSLFCIALYQFSLRCLMTALPEAHRPAQAANVVRIFMKVGALLYWVLSGDFQRIIWIGHEERVPADFEGTMWVLMALNILYIWEVSFRELRAVNVAHHIITCLGVFSCMEWLDVTDTTRTFVPIPICGSLIEAFCCMGTVAYRFMPRGKTLANLMLGEMVFVLISYNALAVTCYLLWQASYDVLSFTSLIGVPVLYLFTYPAQMNMARIFYTLYKKATKPSTPTVPLSAVKEAAAIPERAMDTGRPVRSEVEVQKRRRWGRY